MSIQVLVKRAIKGEEEAFYELMLQHKEQLYKIAFSYLKSQEESLEAIQEVTYRAYRSIGNLKEPSFLNTWLVRIMMNYCSDELRKKKRVSLLQSNELEQVSVHHDSYERIEIEEALDALDQKSKQVIKLKYFFDFKISDIAKVMDCPEGTVKTWLHKALIGLRKHLQVKGEE